VEEDWGLAPQNDQVRVEELDILGDVEPVRPKFRVLVHSELGITNGSVPIEVQRGPVSPHNFRDANETPERVQAHHQVLKTANQGDVHGISEPFFPCLGCLASSSCGAHQSVKDSARNAVESTHGNHALE